MLLRFKQNIELSKYLEIKEYIEQNINVEI